MRPEALFALHPFANKIWASDNAKFSAISVVKVGQRTMVQLRKQKTSSSGQGRKSTADDTNWSR